MNAAKKRRIENKGRTFQKQWPEKYFFVGHSEKAVCLVCEKSISVLKDYNLKGHFEKNHKEFEQFVGEKNNGKNRKMKKRILCPTVNV